MSSQESRQLVHEEIQRLLSEAHSPAGSGVSMTVRVFRQFGLGGVDKISVRVYPKGTEQTGRGGSRIPADLP